MPSPITSDDFTNLNYSGSICGKLSELLKVSEKLGEFFQYAFNSDGSISDGFADDMQLILASQIGVPVGSVIFSPVSSVPAGYLIANGQAVSRTTYADLYQRFGTLFGSGDESSTFNLPNMTDRFAIGSGGTYNAGGTGGEAEHVLTPAEGSIQGHKHVFGRQGNLAQDDGQFLKGETTTIPAQNSSFIPGDTDTPTFQNLTEGDFHTAGPIGAEDPNETSDGHNNIPPYMAGLWLIKY